MNPEEKLNVNIERIVRAGQPVTGPFYWVPRPKWKGPGFTWEIVPFYQPDEQHQIGHTRVWPEVLHLLAHWWGRNSDAIVKQLKDDYTGLPRGRVVKMTGGFGIAHGDDHSDPDFVVTVKKLYYLPADSQAFFDEHERMIPGDPEKFQEVLGIKTGLKGADVDWDETDS